MFDQINKFKSYNTPLIILYKIIIFIQQNCLSSLFKFNYMQKIILYFLFGCFTTTSLAQPVKTALYDLVKKLIPDSTGYENVGDWAVGKPKKFPVKWKEDRLIMSEDTSINFYRMGNVDISSPANTDVKWNIMLKGPRMGYTSFSIISTLSKDLINQYSLDSLFKNKSYKAKLIKKCNTKPVAGYYYYELKLPKKDIAFIKTSWVLVNGNAALRIDCYDNRSKYAVKLNCP